MAWLSGGWQNRIKLTVDPTKVIAESIHDVIETLANDQTDFDGLVLSSDSDNIAYITDTTEYHSNGAAGRLSTDGTRNETTGYIEFSGVDLSGAQYLSFWAKGEHINAQWMKPTVTIDGTTVWDDWSPTDNVQYPWQKIDLDVSSYTGTHDIRFVTYTEGTSWDYRRFFFDDVVVSAGYIYADWLTDYPVFVDLSSIPSAFFDDVQSDGADIRITKNDGTTELPREVVWLDTAGNDGELHFLADLSTQTGTEFYLYYNNSTASEPAPGGATGAYSVWADYTHVFHGELIETSNAIPAGTSIGIETPIGASHSTTDYGVIITIDGTVTLRSATINPTETGTLTVELWNYTRGVEAPHDGTLVETKDFTISATGVQDITLDFENVTSGDYFLSRKGSFGLIRTPDATGFPYGIAGAAVINGSAPDAIAGNGYYYYFYGIDIEGSVNSKNVKNSVDGTLTEALGSPSYQDTPMTRGLDIDGKSVDFDTPISMQGTYSFSYWMRSQRNSDFRVLNNTSGINNTVFHYGSRISLGGNDDLSHSAISADTWYKFSVSADENTAQLHLNGVQQSTVESSLELSIDRIGGLSAGTSWETYRGDVGELRFGDVAIPGYKSETEWENQNNFSTFMSFGTVETDSGGGTNHEVDLTDNVGVTDTTATARAVVLALADNVGVNDTLASQLAAIRTVANTVGVTDTLSTLLQQLVSVLLQDNVGVADAANITATYLRGIADTVDVTDEVATAVGYAIELSDNVGVNDAITKTLVYFIALSDTVGVTDALDSLVFQLVSVSLSDNVGVTDTATRVATLLRAVQDNVGITDVQTAIGTYIRTIADTAGVTDAINAGLALVVQLAATVGITDDITALSAGLVTASISDTVGVTDTATKAHFARIVLQETLGVTDSVTRAAEFVRQLLDTVDVDDDLARRLEKFVSLVDTVGVTDEVDTAFITDKLVDFAESVGVSDAVIAQVLRQGDDWFGRPGIVRVKQLEPKAGGVLESLIPRIIGEGDE